MAIVAYDASCCPEPEVSGGPGDYYRLRLKSDDSLTDWYVPVSTFGVVTEDTYIYAPDGNCYYVEFDDPPVVGVPSGGYVMTAYEYCGPLSSPLTTRMCP